MFKCELVKEDGTIEVLLFVAGKSSPLINSTYVFKVTGTFSDDINDTIIKKDGKVI